MGVETRPIVSLRVLVLDPDAREGEVIQHWLTPHGHGVLLKTTIEEALAEAVTQAFDVAILCWRLGAARQLEVFNQLRQENPWMQCVIVCSSIDSMEAITAAIGSGDADLVMRPITRPQAEYIACTAAKKLELRRNAGAMRVTMGRLTPMNWTSGNLAAQRVLDLAKQVAACRASILLCGEPGTGKRSLGRMIHDWSPRAAGPFVAVRCRMDSPDSFEAELFGTGEVLSGGSADLTGLVSLCEHGTLLLEEVGLMPQSLQPRLLALLRDQEYERRGDWRLRRADVRIIATSSIDLSEAVERGRLRRELMMTLDSIRIDLPPLRERREDIAALAVAYLKFFAHETSRHAGALAPQAMQALEQYSWPGNLRELRNLMERAVMVGESAVIGLEQLPANLRVAAPPAAADTIAPAIATTPDAIPVVAARRVDDAIPDTRINPVRHWHSRRSQPPTRPDDRPDSTRHDDLGPRKRKPQAA